MKSVSLTLRKHLPWVITLLALGGLIGPPLYSQTQVANAPADLANKILMVADSTTGRTVTNLFTFNRGAAVPFAVDAASLKVTNLDADKLDGQTGTYYNDPANFTSAVTVAKGGTGLASGTSGGVLAFTAAGTIASSAALVNSAIVVGGGAGSPPATSGGFLINTSILSSSTQPRAVVYPSAVQSIADATETVLTFNTEDVDVASLHDNVTNNSRLTIPTSGDGYYLVSIKVDFASNATGQRYIGIKKNGTTYRYLSIVRAVSAASDLMINGTIMLNLVATDYIEVCAYQDSGGALNVGSATRTVANEFSAVKLW